MVFSYTAGDYLFDELQVLLHLHYSSIDMYHGMIDHFLLCLHNGNVDALESFQCELAFDFPYQLHGIHDVGMYLSKMCLSTSVK
jgi:hypothetical protein